ncbi:hypothetical protein [Methylobacterium terrae]|uniref:hypothetical protein n=1 Tax=Methylobacterium terrae TaxID=2202827 RepID=UPI0013A59B58|nr:hypothetical protein [Methylobacterium terrae]
MTREASSPENRAVDRGTCNLAIHGLPAGERAKLTTLAAEISRLAEVSENPIEFVEAVDRAVRLGIKFDLDRDPAGRTGELRLTLQFSEALLDLCPALRTGNVDAEFVGESSHDSSSIGLVGPSDGSGTGRRAREDRRPDARLDRPLAPGERLTADGDRIRLSPQEA